MLTYLQSIAAVLGVAFLVGFLQSYAFAAPPMSPERKCLAVEAVLIAEAGGEGRAGIAAVAEVIRNRMNRDGKSAFEVVTARKQFSCLNGTTIDKLIKRFDHVHVADAFKFSRILSRDPNSRALGDTTHGATHYHEESICPRWADPALRTVQIKHHIFYRL